MACVGLAGASLGERVALAQGGENDYVDVALRLEYPPLASSTTGRYVTVIVMNHGARTAYDVEVVVDIVYPEDSSHWSHDFAVPQVPVGSASLEDDDYSFRWTIPALKGLHREEFNVNVRSSDPDPPNEFDKESYPHEFFGEVTTASFESDLRKENNTDRFWFEVINNNYHSRKAKGSYGIKSLSVDNQYPSAGGIVNFTIFATMVSSIDSEIAFELTDGLAVDIDTTATPPRAISYVKSPSGSDDPDYSNGVFTIGTRSYDELLNQLHATVPIRVASNAAVNEQCLTATITGNPPAGAGPFDDDISDNVAEFCLGAPSMEPLVSGQLDAFTVYPCVGETDSPCDSTDDVRVRAVNSSSGRVLAPGTALFRINPTSARVYDAYANSITGTNDNKVTWRIPVTWDAAKLHADRSNWSKLTDGFALKQIGNDPRPGSVHIRAFEDSTAPLVYKMNSATTPPWVGEDTVGFNPSSLPTPDPFKYFAEFEKLGTYKLEYTVKLTRTTADGDEDCLPDSSTPPVNQAFCASETYTFHVGPMADLAVEDGGASPHVAADQSALAIVAFNNGPDEPSGGARVAGLPTGAEVIYKSQGQYDPNDGVWNIGELKPRDYYRSRGEIEPTLVLGASAGDTASVSIAGAKNYEVCVGPKSNPINLAHTTQVACEAVTNASWNSTPVYDYDDSNSKDVTITAARGTRGVGPIAPGNPRTTTGITAVTWGPVQYLYSVPVVRYEVQRLDGSSWTTLDDGVTGTVYVDTAPSGGRDYRVRAVNASGVPGPWSRSTAEVQAGKAGPPVNLRTQADGNNAIDVSWDAPEDAGGSAVTGYTVQWSADGTGGWSNAGSTSDQTFKHRGLQVGAVRYYRVAARNSGGLGLWSDPVMGQTVSGVPAAPTLKAKSLSDYEIELTWNEPKDNGKPITGYRIEWSSDGSANSWNGLADVSADPTSYVDSSLSANERRHYRVRAVNGVGNGGWSRSVSAITQLTPPSAPNLTGAEADGPNAIVVTWEEPSFLGDLSITQYQVQWAKDPDSQIWRGPQSLSGSTLSWRHTGLKPAETWYYQVRASNGGGRWSPWSYILAATTASDNAPKAVSGLGVQYDSESDQVNVTWNEQTGGDTAFSYDLQRSEDGSDWRDLATVSTCDAGKCAYADRDIWRGAKLYYRVRASIDGDAGPWSGAQSASVPPDPPDEPFVMWAEANGSDQIYYEWEPSYDDGGAPVTGYRLLWCRVLDGADDNPCDVTPDEDNPLADPPGYSRIALGASVRSYTQSVSAGYVYYYLLRATNGGNRWSEWGYVYSITVYPGLPAAPGLTARAVDANQIKLTWTRPSSPGSEIGEYWLYIYRYGENLYDFTDTIIDILRIPGDQTEYTLGGLEPETTRYFRVRALNDNGEGKYSPLRQATTPASTQSQAQARNDAVLPNSRPRLQ